MPEPFTLAAGFLLLALPGRDDVSGGGPTPPSDGNWGFPMEAWRGYLPTRSDDYHAVKTAAHREHHGCDLMYRRKPGGPDAAYPKGITGTGALARAYGTRDYFVPDNAYACAARDGTLWQVGQGGHGKYVVIDHGKPFATFYQHLSSVLFSPLNNGAGGIKVKRGDRLGVIGYSPLDGERLMHLHFEVWYQGGARSHVDPWPLLATAPIPR